MTKTKLTTLTALSLLAIGAHPAQAQAPKFTDNAVWLPDYNELTNVPDMLEHMQSYDIRYLFPIDGALKGSGKYGGSAELATGYMNDIHAYELRTGYKFKVMLFMVGNLTSWKPNYVNIGDPAIRATVAEECAKFTSSAVPGSFVAGASRTFDGVVLDLEPGGVSGSVANFELLGKAIRSAIGSDKLIGFYTPAYNASAGDWGWNRSEYYDMAASGDADYLMAATYGGAKSSDKYQAAMREQVTDILRAVSGVAFDDGKHPAPTNGVRVFIGFPTFEGSQRLVDASIAARRAVNALDPVSASFALGAHVFRQVNGDGKSGTATYATDWPNFNTYWLGNPSPNPAPLPASLYPGKIQQRTGSSATIIVSGSKFVRESVVQMNGIALPTTFENSGTLRAVVPSSALGAAATGRVTVFTPRQADGTGAESASLPLVIAPDMRLGAK